MTSPRKNPLSLASETLEINGSLINALIPLEPCVGQSFAKELISVKTMSGRTLHLTRHLFFNRSDQPVLWLLTAVLHEVNVH